MLPLGCFRILKRRVNRLKLKGVIFGGVDSSRASTSCSYLPYDHSTSFKSFQELKKVTDSSLRADYDDISFIM